MRKYENEFADVDCWILNHVSPNQVTKLLPTTSSGLEFLLLSVRSVWMFCFSPLLNVKLQLLFSLAVQPEASNGEFRSAVKAVRQRVI